MSKLINIAHQAGQRIQASFDKEMLKQIPEVSSHPQLSNDANWGMVSLVYKHNSSSKRIVLSFKGDYSGIATAKVKGGMNAGDQYELKKIIISGTNRVPLISIERFQISNPSELDLVLGSGGEVEPPPPPAATTVTLTSNVSNSAISEYFTVTASFNKPITTFTSETQISATNATVSTPVEINSSTYEFYVYPNGGFDGEVITVSILQNALSGGNSSSNTITKTYYSPVTVVLTSTAPEEVNGSWLVTATFNRPVTGFTLSDILSRKDQEVGYVGVPKNLTGSGAVYTFEMDPVEAGVFSAAFVGASIPALTVVDENGITNPYSSNIISRFYVPTKTLTLSKSGIGTASAFDFDTNGLLVSANGAYVSNLNTKLIKLQANSTFGNYFEGWSGDLVSSSNIDSLSLNADKSVTATFKESWNVAGGFFRDPAQTTIDPIINGSLRQSDGKIIVWGRFLGFDDVIAENLIRFNVDGTVDSTFNAGRNFGGPSNHQVYTVNVDSSGNIWIGGTFTSFKGSANNANRIAKLDSSGNLLKVNAADINNSTGNGFNGAVWDIKFDSSGNIWAVGEFTSYKGTANNANRIAKLDSVGSLLKVNAADTNASTGNGFNTTVNVIAFDLSGNVWVGGEFTSYKGTANNSNKIAKLDSSGNLLKINAADTNTSTGNGFDSVGTVYTIKFDSSNNIWLGGIFTSYKGTTNNANKIAKLDSSGNLLKINAADTNTATGNGFNSTVWDIKFDSSGNVLVGGEFVTYKGTTNNANKIAKLDSNGNLLKINSTDSNSATGNGFNPTTMITGAAAAVKNILLDSSDNILVTGSIRDFFQGQERLSSNLIAYLQKDVNNNYIKNNNIYSIRNQKNNITWNFLETSGSVKVKFQSNGKMIGYGDFVASFNNKFYRNLIRFNVDGTVDETFNVGTASWSTNPTFNATVYCVEIDSSDNIWVGGGFTSYKGTANNANYLAKLDSSGNLLKVNAADTNTSSGNGFNPSTSAYVSDIKFDSAGNIWLVGWFTQYKATGATLNANYLAKLDSSGNLLKVNAADTNTSTGNGFNTITNVITLDSSGNIWVGGEFTSYKGTANNANRIAKLDSSGSLLKVNAADTNASTGNGFSDRVHAIKFDSSGNAWVGGSFTSYKGTARNANGIAKLDSSGNLLKINAADTNTATGNGFNAASLAVVSDIAFDSSNNIWVIGAFTAYKALGTAYNANNIAKLDSGGNLLKVDAADVNGIYGNGFDSGLHQLQSKLTIYNGDLYLAANSLQISQIGNKMSRIMGSIKLYGGSSLKLR